MRLLASLAVLAFTTPAFAQAPGETPVVPASQPAEPAAEKDPGTAVLISVGATLGSGVLFLEGAKANSGGIALLGVGGLLIGPSVGRWYSGSNGAGSLAIRGASGVAMLAGLVMVLSTEDCEGSSCDTNGNVGAALLLGGLGTWGATTIYDVIMAGHDAREYNERHAAASVRLQPAMISSAGHHTMGLALEGRF